MLPGQRPVPSSPGAPTDATASGPGAPLPGASSGAAVSGSGNIDGANASEKEAATLAPLDDSKKEAALVAPVEKAQLSVCFHRHAMLLMCFFVRECF